MNSLSAFDVLALIGVALVVALHPVAYVRPRRYVAAYVEYTLRHILGTAVRVQGSRLRIPTHPSFRFLTSPDYALSNGAAMDSTFSTDSAPSVVLQGLTVANPKGFPNEPALEIDRVVVLFRDGSHLTDESLAVSEIQVKGLRVHLRYALGKGTNLGPLLAHARCVAAKAGPRQPRSVRRPYTVTCLRCEDVQIEFGPEAAPNSGMELNLGSFRVRRIGEDRPVTVADMSVAILEYLLEEGMDLEGFLQPVARAIREDLQGVPDPRARRAKRAIRA